MGPWIALAPAIEAHDRYERIRNRVTRETDHGKWVTFGLHPVLNRAGFKVERATKTFMGTASGFYEVIGLASWVQEREASKEKADG